MTPPPPPPTADAPGAKHPPAARKAARSPQAAAGPRTLGQRFHDWTVRRRGERLTVPNILRRVDTRRLDRLRQRASEAEGDQAYFWTKYLDVEKWLALNVRYAHELGLVERPPRRVLDLGCGGGYFLSVCRHLGASVLGLDLNTDAILNELVALFRLKRLAWNIRPFVKLPAFRGRFDLITAWMICFNLPLDKPAWGPREWDFLLADLHTYLEPGGRVVLSLNKQLDDGQLYNDELRAYFEGLGAQIDGKRLVFDEAELGRAGAITADVPRPPHKARRLFRAVRPPQADAPPTAAAPAVTGTRPLAIDRAVLLDFRAGEGPAALAAEARALFFLAAWQRNVGAPLEVVSVGEPPETVARLAARTGARVTVHPPLELAGGLTLNAPRGWEAPGEAPRLLMLSPETLAFADPAPALATLPVNSLVAAPADKSQVPEDCWPAIYAALGLALPAETVRPLRAELYLPLAGGPDAMLPYYKGAILLTPRACDLPAVWAGHYETLARLLPTVPGVPEAQRPRLIASAGKAALTTAIQELLARPGGEYVYRRLPLACDGRLTYFEAAADMPYPRLLHVPGLFKRLDDLSQIPDALAAYAFRWRSTVAEGARERGFGDRTARLYSAWANRRLERTLQRLYQGDVRDTLRACGLYAA